MVRPKLRLAASNMRKGLISPSDALGCLCLKGFLDFALSLDLSPDLSPDPSCSASLALLDGYGGEQSEKGRDGGEMNKIPPMPGCLYIKAVRAMKGGMGDKFLDE